MFEAIAGTMALLALTLALLKVVGVVTFSIEMLIYFCTVSIFCLIISVAEKHHRELEAARRQINALARKYGKGSE